MTQEPMLCKKVDDYRDYLDNAQYGFQWKWDGNGMFAEVFGEALGTCLEVARSHTKYDVNGIPFAAKFKDVADELSYLPSGLYQGELVAYRKDNGREEIFTVNIKPENMAQYNFVLRLHDILESEGKNWRDNPYKHRLRYLQLCVQEATQKCGKLSHIAAAGISVTRDEKLGLVQMVNDVQGEGVVIKDLNAPYTPGKHEPCLKFKRMYGEHKETHDCVVIGLTKTKGEKKQPPNPFGALILAQYVPTYPEQTPFKVKKTGLVPMTLKFVCKCAGISDADRADIWQRLQSVKRVDAKDVVDFDNVLKGNVLRTEVLCAVDLQLVVEIKCMNTTKDGHYRAPNFLRIRDDKLASECIKEV
jgi:ATP-dependent DNA ligase